MKRKELLKLDKRKRDSDRPNAPSLIRLNYLWLRRALYVAVAALVITGVVYGQSAGVYVYDPLGGVSKTYVAGATVRQGQLVTESIVSNAHVVSPTTAGATSGAIGVATNNAASGAIVTVALLGATPLSVDNSCSFGNIVTISASQNGNGTCGSSFGATEIIGMALTTTASGSIKVNISPLTATVQAGAGGTSSFSGLTPGINSSAGTFGFSGNTFSLAAANFLVPTTSSCSASGTNNLVLDTTNNNFDFWNGLSCLISLGIASGGVTASGDVAGLNLSGGSVSVSDLGAPSGHAGLAPFFLQIVNTASFTAGDYIGIDVSGNVDELTPGFVIQNVASPLTMTSAQRGHLLYLTGTGSQTTSIPGPSQTGFGLSYYSELWNLGTSGTAGNNTVTPANGALISGGCNNVSGAASAVIDGGAWGQIISDNTNYFLLCASTPFSTSTFTNKTFDTAGAGNVFKINGTAISAITGTGSAVLATSPTITTPTISGNLTTNVTGSTQCVQANSSGVLSGTGAGCGGNTIWSAIGNPSGNLTLTMGTDTSTFNYSSALASAFFLQNNTAATSGANQSSPVFEIGGFGWIGGTPASTSDNWTLQDVLSAGTNPTSTLTWTHTGTTGTSQMSFAGWTFTSGGGITVPGGVSISLAPTGANQSLTLRGAFLSAGNSGAILVQGGNNNGTGIAGLAQLMAGGNSSTGPNGLVQVVAEWAKGTTVTANNLECESADSTIADCAASPVNVIGIATGTVTANPIQVVTAGEALVNVSAAVSVGQHVCAGSTAGQGTGQSGSTACTLGTEIGIVKSISLNGSSSTLPLVTLHIG